MLLPNNNYENKFGIRLGLLGLCTIRSFEFQLRTKNNEMGKQFISLFRFSVEPKYRFRPPFPTFSLKFISKQHQSKHRHRAISNFDILFSLV